MAAENALMRPLRSDSLKPRPSTQAVWEPRKADAEPPVQPEAVQEAAAEIICPDPQPETEPAVQQPEPPEEPACQEAAAEAEDEPVQMEEPPEDAVQEEPSLPSYTEAVFTFAPACSAQPELLPEEPETDAPAETPACPEPGRADEEEEPFDLDAVIAAILNDDEDGEDEEDLPSAQDALPTEEMPEPAVVPLYETPKAAPRRKGWIWLIGAALIVAAAGYAARRFGWLN